ncbi:uncharacterized protein MONBRDRAFT_27282 [Monosiga brevicollis MX1]|uniref:Major facilitator superfamily (MFS) profile domain-containing protein n=1 Tax=Monosiga brevicollis TaxID=81824 RepID=A9V4U7_MONBE|nr:uncharacterized protein MONBRDRAFT_27282 [Monosiga brevicollis MX1]EDQ87518.1 predicted protein [Monosiga brevicollis MX1]|eukprot:XP_001747778.1 hypothetical protein [Monosiga brevicollis MX1]
MLALRFGARRVLAVAALGWSVLTIWTPTAAEEGETVIYGVRVILGVFEGMCFPCVYDILSASHPELRSRNISLQTTATFFVAGEDWRLQARIAWRLFLHPNCRAIFVGHFAHAFCHFLALSWLPTYYDELDAGVSAGPTGHRSHASQLMAPYIIMMSTSMGGAFVADHFVRAGVDKSRVRRLCEAISYGLAAGAMLLVLLLPQGGLTTALLSFSIGMSGLSTNGHEAAKLDVAPTEFVGLLQGISNSLAALSGVVGVPVAAYINAAFGTWQAVFALVAMVYATGGLAYWFLGTSDPIPRGQLLDATTTVTRRLDFGRAPAK